MNAWLWWWQQYAQGAIDAYAARVGCRIRTPALAESVGRLRRFIPAGAGNTC